MKKTLLIFTLFFVSVLATPAFAASGGGGGVGSYTWKMSYKNCWDEISQSWDTFAECDEANGTCTDQYCAPC